MEYTWDKAQPALTQNHHYKNLQTFKDGFTDDEVQKIVGWSETVKRLWDEDMAAGCNLKVILLGSAPLLIQRGLTESLAGRFEILHLPHWTFSEMRSCFGWNLDTYLFHGSYPGAAPLITDHAVGLSQQLT